MYYVCIIKPIFKIKNKTMMKSIMLSLLMLLSFSNLFSQPDCSSKIFTNEVELNEWLGFYKNDTVSLLNCIREHSSDSIITEKLPDAIYLIKNLAIRSSNDKVINVAIKFFLATCKSKKSGISTLSINALKRYPSVYFDNSDIDSIAVLIEKYPLIFKESVELAGYLGNSKFLTTIHNVFPSSRTFSKPERWATYKALARLGDQEALDYCVGRISSLQLNDQVVDAVYPDLIYIHRKEAFELLIKALNSDENLCSSSNPNNDGKILCGYRIMEMLAPEIENFPVKVLPSGDLDSKDYRKTLYDVRAWFEKNRNSYVIINKY